MNMKQLEENLSSISIKVMEHIKSVAIENTTLDRSVSNYSYIYVSPEKHLTDENGKINLLEVATLPFGLPVLEKVDKWYLDVLNRSRGYINEPELKNIPEECKGGIELFTHNRITLSLKDSEIVLSSEPRYSVRVHDPYTDSKHTKEIYVGKKHAMEFNIDVDEDNLEYVTSVTTTSPATWVKFKSVQRLKDTSDKSVEKIINEIDKNLLSILIG